MSELREPISRFNMSKSPLAVVKGIGNNDTPRLLAVINSIVRRGEFPKRWKTTRLMLLQKPGMDPARSDAYKPICITGAGSKLVEYLIQGRLLDAVGPEGLAPNQFGFRRGRSTVQALECVRRVAEGAVR